MTQANITPDLIKEDGQNRIARTGQQVGLAGSVVVVGEWVAQQAGWGGTLPTYVSAAMVAILTGIGSWWMNRKRLKGKA